MAKEEMIAIKEADLTNNCPECFNQEIKLTFYQKHKHSKLFHKITNEVSHGLQCLKCDSTIYPSTWTEDIERVFEYYQKMVVPEKFSLKLKPLFYILVAVLFSLIGTGFYLYKEGLIPYEF
ncbi:MAG: hypothetical protein V3U92_08175 [Cellulophaga sp.]